VLAGELSGAHVALHQAEAERLLSEATRRKLLEDSMTFQKSVRQVLEQDQQLAG
jgi:hypothetical protein